MPSWAHLSDQQLADVLNHVATAWGNAAQLPPGAVEFTALEVALERAFPVDQATLIATRHALTRLSEQYRNGARRARAPRVRDRARRA